MGQQRRHEAPEIGGMVRRMVRALVRRAAEGDTEALEQLVALEAELGVAVSCAMGRMNYGPQHYSAAQLADVVGTSRQAVRQRIGRVLMDDTVAGYYSDGASTRADWTPDQ